MVQIHPFRGLRYNPEKVPHLQAVTAPPYDVINPEQQKALHDQDPHNIVRLILGYHLPADTVAENAYSRAHHTLEAWRAAGILKEEAQPAFYAYTQRWDNQERRGFIGRLQLEAYETGQVLPHEYTLGGPKADRLALMKATGSVLSPIFGLYHDPQKTIESRLFETTAPEVGLEVLDQDKVLHRFWPVTDPDTIALLQQTLQDKAVLIADGHHRYETAVAYRDWRRQQDHAEDTPLGALPWDYTMAFFTNMADEGLVIYPTHRVFTGLPTGWTIPALLDRLGDYFEPTEIETALFWVQPGQGPKQAYRLKPGVDVSTLPGPLQTLDVALLDQLVFQQILGQSANEMKQQHQLHFIRDEAEVAALLQHPDTLVFWVHAPDVNQVRQICEAGYRMPQKSTYFYPKLLSGLVLYYYGPQGLDAPSQRTTAQNTGLSV